LDANKLNTTLMPHSITHGDACFAYFNKIRGIPWPDASASKRTPSELFRAQERLPANRGCMSINFVAMSLLKRTDMIALLAQVNHAGSSHFLLLSPKTFRTSDYSRASLRSITMA
jgi:hypothetical protein